jgi:translation elongation factor EF-4
VTELGIMYPEEIPTTSLHPGQVGYIACNMKESVEGKDELEFSAKVDL